MIGGLWNRNANQQRKWEIEKEEEGKGEETTKNWIWRKLRESMDGAEEEMKQNEEGSNEK